MTRLRVPDLLHGGEWEHALVLTYSLDLPFYERDLGRALGRVPNRLVLADARRLAGHFDDVAGGGEGLHGANVTYAVGGITGTRSAHAKLILLAAPAEGLAVIGSGNLTLGGYASQGEQFCVYRYDGHPEQLPPFAAVRQLLDGLAAREQVDPVARWHLDRIWAGAPWLGATAPPDTPVPVRHNLHAPLLTQLTDRIGGRPVSEVTVHAPFYDPGCMALRLPLGALGEALLKIATTVTQDEMLDQVTAAFGSRRARCCAERRQLIRASPFGDHVRGQQIVTAVLVIDDDRAVADPGRASDALAAWMAAEKREYYRIHLPQQQATAVADPGLGVYWLKTSDGTQPLLEPESEKPAWLASAERLSQKLGHGAEAA